MCNVVYFHGHITSPISNCASDKTDVFWSLRSSCLCRLTIEGGKEEGGENGEADGTALSEGEDEVRKCLKLIKKVEKLAEDMAARTATSGLATISTREFSTARPTMASVVEDDAALMRTALARHAN